MVYGYECMLCTAVDEVKMIACIAKIKILVNLQLSVNRLMETA